MRLIAKRPGSYPGTFLEDLREMALETECQDGGDVRVRKPGEPQHVACGFDSLFRDTICHGDPTFFLEQAGEVIGR